MFKVGDKVRCIDNSGVYQWLTKNNIYTVSSVANGSVRVNNQAGPWFSHRFELVKEEEVKPLDLSKKYVDSNGATVELFAHKDGRYWGRSKIVSGWTEGSWSEYNHGLSVKKEKIKREYWLVHFNDGMGSSHWGVTAEKTANSEKTLRNVLAVTGPHYVEFEVEEK